MKQKDTFSGNRYPGIKPFSESEASLFFGREDDIEKLNSLTFLKQMVVLYGKSGYGKSSLINAGVIPRLRQTDSWNYFLVRFNNFSEKKTEQNLSPLETAQQRMSEGMKQRNESEFEKVISGEKTLWYWLKLNQQFHKKTKFIILFDQFEELFTYPKEQIAEFSEQLSQLLYNTIPPNIRRQINELGERGMVSRELHSFLYDKPEIKALFSIRSDRLSLMNKLTDRHPSILQNCYELDSLEPAEATQAIRQPAKLIGKTKFKTPPFEYTDSAIEKILKGIADPLDGKIETITLQIVCKHIENNLVGNQKIITITEENIGDIRDIFQQYYGNILQKFESGERLQVQMLLEDELIESGRRNPLSATYIQTKFNFSEKLLSELEAASLLRKERDGKGIILIELSHDVLIAPISTAREKRIALQEEEKLLLEREEKKKIEEQLRVLQKARELEQVEKRGFQLKRSAANWKTYKLYLSQVKLLYNKKKTPAAILAIFLFLFICFSVVWSGIATYKYISKGRKIRHQKEMIEQVNKEFNKILQSYDSTVNPGEYKNLIDLYNQYKKIKKI